MLLYSTLLYEKIARAPGGMKDEPTKLGGGQNGIDLSEVKRYDFNHARVVKGAKNRVA